VSSSGDGFWGVGNVSNNSSIYVEYWLLTARTLDEETVVTMLDSGPDRSDSFEARSRSGVLATLKIYKKPFS
jgi:hypothetical protein